MRLGATKWNGNLEIKSPTPSWPNTFPPVANTLPPARKQNELDWLPFFFHRAKYDNKIESVKGFEVNFGFAKCACFRFAREWFEALAITKFQPLEGGHWLQWRSRPKKERLLQQMERVVASHFQGTKRSGRRRIGNLGWGFQTNESPF